MDCLACDRIKQIGLDTNPYYVTELSESYVVLADNQRYEGYCILLLKDHNEHLLDIPETRQKNLFQDVPTNGSGRSERVCSCSHKL